MVRPVKNLDDRLLNVVPPVHAAGGRFRGSRRSRELWRGRAAAYVAVDESRCVRDEHAGFGANEQHRLACRRPGDSPSRTALTG
jgi:hypothetical protein